MHTTSLVAAPAPGAGRRFLTCVVASDAATQSECHVFCENGNSAVVSAPTPELALILGRAAGMALVGVSLL